MVLIFLPGLMFFFLHEEHVCDNFVLYSKTVLLLAGNPSRKVCIIEYVQDVILCYNYMMVSTPSQMPFTVAFIPHKLTQISNIALGRCCLCVRFGEYFCGASWFSRIRSISF